MIKKIISGGQTGADRAALDFAIKHKIPHGGWVPKGRIAEDGPLPKKYRLTEMPTDSYQKRTELNVIGSDGTLIFSHGKLTGGSAYTRTMAKRHNKPHLHIDLNETDIFQASLLMLEWIDEQEIKTINVAGPRESKDPKIYERVTDVLDSTLILKLKREELASLPKLKKKPTAKSFKRPTTVDEAVDILMTEMKLKDLNKLAQMPEDDLVYLHFTVGMWVRSNFVYPRNDRLLESCRELTGDKYLHWAQMHMVIIRELWKRLQETHKLKVVK
jgi:hypothetical protein